MVIEVSNVIKITEPTDELVEYIMSEYTVNNPEYLTKKKLGIYYGNTPEKLNLYSGLRSNGKDTITLGYGALDDIRKFGGEIIRKDLIGDIRHFKHSVEIPLYDYQKEAVSHIFLHNECGILQSAPGSGKTQMGIALAARLGRKTLWITHTKDLLQQSYDRACLYFPKNKLGKITDGKISIGECMTFATIQTLVRLDPQYYSYEFGCVIVDECHRVSGTPTRATQFMKVLNNLHSLYKYGLSATVHRSDGMIKTTYSLLGNVIYTVPDEAVADKIIKPIIRKVKLDTEPSEIYLDSSGMMIYNDLIQYLVDDDSRNFDIVMDLLSNKDRHCLVLSDRINHLDKLYEMLNLKNKSVVINGKMKKEERQKAIEDMRNGKKNFLFATYSLAKEGLDIPILDRLFLVTPHSDYAVVTQSVGRISRTFEGKEDAVVYDYVDENIVFLKKNFQKRISSYRKLGVVIE